MTLHCIVGKTFLFAIVYKLLVHKKRLNHMLNFALTCLKQLNMLDSKIMKGN